ncbi:MAG TPA: hypothetical protein VNE86_05000 [Nitrososphaerales archaeon]|nr:hypothetical protein [Nitrososphaerales archaeon]
MPKKDSKSLAIARRKEVLESLKQLGQKTYDDVDNGKFPEFAFPSRSVSNIVYDPKLKQYVLDKINVKRSAGNIKHIRPFTQLLWLAYFADKLVTEGKTSTLRDAYYSSQADAMEFVDQAESDEIITDLETVLARAREEFKIYPEERSAIFGDLTIEYTVPRYEGKRLNLNSHPDGYLIGPSLSTAEFVETSAEMVIAVEKGGIFTRFVEEEVEKKYKAILVDTSGQAPRSTRYMLKRLNKELNLPVYVMTDGDVYGEHIAMVVISGSANAAHLRDLTVPTAKWIGVWASITGDEPVVVKKNGLIRNLEIGKFFEASKEAAEGRGSSINAESPEAYCCSEVGEVSTKPISAVTSHPYDGDIYEIKTLGGFRVKTTGNHSVQVFNKETCALESIQVSSLKKGDLVASCFSVPNNESLTEINIARLIADEYPELAEHVFVEGEEAFEFSNYLSGRYSKRILRENFIQVLQRKENGVKLSYFFAEGKVPSSGSLRLRYSQHRIPVVVRELDNFARLMGYYAAEGGLSKGARGDVCELTFGITEDNYVNDARECISRSLGLNSKVDRREASHAQRIRFGNSLLAKIFTKVLKSGERVDSKQVPFIFFNVGKTSKTEFIRGYFRGDRMVNYVEGSRLAAKTVSRKLASDLVILLRQLHVTAYVWKSGDSYVVSCSDTEGIQTVVDEICRKSVKVKSKIMNMPADLVYDLKSVISKNVPYGNKSKLHRSLFTGGRTINVGYARLAQTLAAYQISTVDSRLQAIQKFMDNNVALLPITEIKNLGKTNEPVYDIAVDGVHTFVGGLGGLVLHNSDIVKYKLPTDQMTEADVKRAQELKKDPRYHGGVWQRELDIFLKIKRKSELEAFSKFGLTFIVTNYLKEKMEEAKSM